MSWADEKIANPMGYQYAALFPRARDAIWAFADCWCTPTRRLMLPSNICSEVVTGLSRGQYTLIPVEDTTGLAFTTTPVQLYGYRHSVGGEIEIDPLMAGWVGKPICESAIISFGFKKTLNIGCGGAFLTSNQGLAQAMEPHQYWPGGTEFTTELNLLLVHGLAKIHQERAIGFERIAKWDAALGDLLPRIPMEQVMPWRVMRRVPGGKRDAVVSALRNSGLPVGTNYPPLTGSNKWGDEVINFYPDHETPMRYAKIIRDVLHG